MTDTAKEVERPMDEQRMRDLLRYARHHLWEEKLLSYEEYAALVADSDNGTRVARLEVYDALRVKLGEAEKRAEEQWDCVMSQSCGLAYDYKGKFFTNARAERSEALVGKLKEALENIVEMNRQHALDQYGDANKAESWSCVVVARAALKACEGGQ